MLFLYNILVVPIIAILIGLLFLGIARKVTARIHRRYGPPVIQPYFDTFKLLTKEDNINHGVMYILGPVIGIAGSIVTLFFIPIGKYSLFSMHGDLILVLYLGVIGSLGMALGAGDSGNPNAAIGVSRGLSLMFSYELPFIIAVVGVILKYNTTSIAEIVQKQVASGWWAIFVIPLSAIVFDIALQGILGEKPFDLPIAPHEINSGPMVEYGGKYLGILQIFASLHLFVELALFVDLFLGGGANIITFSLKMLVVFLIAIFINAIMPRFRMDQAFKFYWKWPFVLGLISLIFVFI